MKKVIRLSMYLFTLSLGLSGCSVSGYASASEMLGETIKASDESSPFDTAQEQETIPPIPPTPPVMKLEDFSEQEKISFGDDYDLYVSYGSNKEFNQELYDKVIASEKLFEEMKVPGNIKFDTDKDGLTDYEEIEIYGSNPDKKSTSGDLYSDGYKVLKGMDIHTYYETGWIKIDDNLSILNEGYISDNFQYSLEENYFKVKGLTYLNIYGYSGFLAIDHSPMYGLSHEVKIDQGFYGDVKLALNQSLDNITIEEYDFLKHTLTPIEFTIDEDNNLCFHYEKFSKSLLIYNKKIKENVEKALKKEYE